jgi:NHL repeat
MGPLDRLPTPVVHRPLGPMLRTAGLAADLELRFLYPVRLPPASLLGARNDLPNPYRPGVSWGRLAEGRKWGSTASITTAPDGTIWVADRCGNSGAGGSTCDGASANVNPVFQFDTSGKLLKTFGTGMFVSPHKLAVDKAGYLWLADNGGHQVFKLTQDGKVLLTLGKKGVAGSGLDEFDAPTDVAIAPNGDIFIGRRTQRRRHEHRQCADDEVRQGREIPPDMGKEGNGP